MRSDIQRHFVFERVSSSCSTCALFAPAELTDCAMVGADQARESAASGMMIAFTTGTASLWAMGHDYSSCRVGRNRISLMSTSSGWLMAKATSFLLPTFLFQ